METDPRMRHDTVLVADAAAGDENAWEELVSRHAQLVWDVVRSYGLGASAAADACIVTWLRCADHLDDLVRGGSIVDWLSCAAAREAGEVLLCEWRAPSRVAGTALDQLPTSSLGASANAGA